MSDRETNAEVTWPDSASSVYRQFDSTASCSICNDFYDTPLLLLCGHSFCSSCIRSFIAHQEGQAKCPQCRAACDERDLRPNIALRELVDKLLQVRPGLIAALRSAKAGHSRLAKKTASIERQDSPADKPVSHKRQLRSSKQTGETAALSSQEDLAESPKKRQRTNSTPQIAADIHAKPANIQKASIEPASTSGLGQCPFCLKHFKAGRVLEAHANRCVDNLPAQQAAQPQAAEPDVKKTKVTKKVQRQIPEVKIPAKIAFHLFNDRKLKDKLKDVNLPTAGKRKELEDRYNRLRLECQLAVDKAESVTEAELIRRALSKEKGTSLTKGFFGAVAKNGLKAAGSGTDALTDSTELPEGDFDSFAVLIKATRERDATRKAEQAKAAAVVATAAETTATLHNSDMPLAADIHLWPAEGSDAVVVQDSSTVESGSLAHRCAVAQPQCQTDAAGQQLMNAPDTEMLLNTSDQFLQQPQSDTCFPGHAQKAAQSNEDAQKAAQAHAHGARSHHTCNGQAVNDAARHSALAGSKPTADCLANSRDGSLQLKRNLQLGNSSISRALPTQHEQSAEDQRSHHVDLTLSDEPDRLSGEMLEFDIDDEHDAVQKPDAQHGRALQHLQLPNARPAFVSSSAHQKLSADPRTDVNHKSVASSVLHSFQFGQSTADALSELDAVVADSNSD